jgi:hypothetical protein
MSDVKTERERQIGVITKFFPYQRYGFLQNGDRKFFFALRDMAQDSARPTEGARVSFLPGQDFRSGQDKAIQVKVEAA